MPFTLENLIGKLPPEATVPLALLALAGALVGVALWLLGSRVGRFFMTLMAVAIGTWVGLRIPGWFSISISRYATAVGGALVLGISAYALHRLWVSVGLGLIVALWIGLGALAVMGTDWLPKLPSQIDGWDYRSYPAAVWQAMPDRMSQVGPLACGLGFLGGVTVGIIFCKVAVYLLYSLLGVSLLIGLGWLSAALARPQLLDLVPEQRSTRVAILAGMVLFGAIVQWRLSVKPAPPPPPPTEKED